MQMTPRTPGISHSDILNFTYSNIFFLLNPVSKFERNFPAKIIGMLSHEYLENGL